MKRVAAILITAVALAGIVYATYQAGSPSISRPDGPLPKYFPAGPMLYLEAKDFSALLADWNSSSEKRNWVKSSNYEVFSRSRLFLRLKGAGDQFAAAAGLPPDMNFLTQVAGTHSAVAIYDIGNLQFLYITYLPSAKSMQSTLWQTRAKFEPRSAAGTTFYVRRDSQSQKEVAFAVAGDYLLLATRQDLLAGALQLLSGSQDRTVETEAWWAQPVSAAGAAGDLRMVMNLETLVPSPYFRTYWVQQNITDMKQYSAAVSDLVRSGKEFREERVLIRGGNSSADPSSGLEAAADIVRLVPTDTGVYEAKASPTAATCADLLETKLLAPHRGDLPASQAAPDVQLTSGESGSGSDLETRIDEAAPPTPKATAEAPSALLQFFNKSQILASLQLQSTERDQAGVFVRIHSAVAFLSSAEWDRASVESAVADYAAPSLTSSHFGVAWLQKPGYEQLDGLWPLTLAIHGKYLIVADDPALTESILHNFDRPVEVKPALLIAGFNHARERGNFSRFTNLLDRNSASNLPGQGREPEFFSQNMASVSETLADRLASEKIVVRPEGAKILQTVTYGWSE